MTHDELAKAYQAFFTKSEAGRHYITEITRLIDDAHKAAEDHPELSRDHVQRAKGLRLSLDHITSVGTEIKRGRS